jgi:tyrosyl-tRNA synthetase
MYGKTLSLPDAALPQWYRLLLARDVPDGVSARDAKHALAHDLVARFHGPEAADAASEEFARVFVDRSLPSDIEEAALDGGVVHLPELLATLFGGSRSDARRKIAQGGVRLDGEPVSELDLPAESLDGRVLQVGKRQFRRLRAV